MTQPVFYLLAGPNGAGKSTLYASAVASGLMPANAEFVNADLYEAAHLQQVRDPQERSRQARQWADQRRLQCLSEGLTFVSETVFSHVSKLALITNAKAQGFAVVLLVVCVDDVRHLLTRVRQREQEGGHGVPAERILARYPRTVGNLSQAVLLADLALLYDTSRPRNRVVQPPRLVGRCRAGRVVWRDAISPPEWLARVLGPQPA